jgi:hypothetical protein
MEDQAYINHLEGKIDDLKEENEKLAAAKQKYFDLWDGEWKKRTALEMMNAELRTLRSKAEIERILKYLARQPGLSDRHEGWELALGWVLGDNDLPTPIDDDMKEAK